MAKCKKLLEENEQLEKMISSDNVAKVEREITLQNGYVFNMKDSQNGKENQKTCFFHMDDRVWSIGCDQVRVQTIWTGRSLFKRTKQL
jgi:hypothetical protein